MQKRKSNKMLPPLASCAATNILLVLFSLCAWGNLEEEENSFKEKKNHNKCTPIVNVLLDL